MRKKRNDPIIQKLKVYIRQVLEETCTSAFPVLTGKPPGLLSQPKSRPTPATGTYPQKPLSFLVLFYYWGERIVFSQLL